jgi:hypothetical protein
MFAASEPFPPAGFIDHVLDTNHDSRFAANFTKLEVKLRIV